MLRCHDSCNCGCEHVHHHHVELEPHGACPNPALAVPFYRAFNAKTVDHIYGTSAEDIISSCAAWYRTKTIAGYIFPSEQPGTIPLYRGYMPEGPHGTDVLLTTNAFEREVDLEGYCDDGIAGYVYPTASCGGVPFLRAYNAEKMNHFYTTNKEEMELMVSKKGYVREGIEGYILPAGH